MSDVDQAEDGDVVEVSSGRIVSVTAEPVGAFLTADVAAAGTVLEVGDAAVFDEIDGGSLRVAGTVYTYAAVAVDNLAETVTIDAGLDADAAEGDRVEVWDLQNVSVVQDWRAQVALPGPLANDEPVDAAISQSLTIQLAQGVRDLWPGESVKMELRGTEWTIIDVKGQEPKVQPAAGGQNVVTGDSSGTNSVSISSTTTGDGTSAALDDYCTSLGDAAYTSGFGATALGRGTDAEGDNATAVGGTGFATGDNAIAINGVSNGQSAIAIGYGHVDGAVRAVADGAVAIGGDSLGHRAVANSVDDFVLGTSNHNVSIPGDFGVHGVTPVGQSATPTTLADVIAILQAHGFCA